MALLHLLHRAGVTVGVACFDHQTRQGESTKDLHFVATAAQTLGVPFFPGGADVSALAAATGESFEMAARRARYAFLIQTAREKGYRAIATGHHADDQAETVLLRLLRGTSPAGLGAIPICRSEEGILIIRPLLTFSRVAIRAWLEVEGIGWREDATNAAIDVLRNRVRNVLLPLLAQEFNPGISRALNRLATLQRADSALLDSLAAAARQQCEASPGCISREAFRALAPALQSRCLEVWIRAAGGEADFDQVSRSAEFLCLGNAGRQQDLGHGASLYLSGDQGVFASSLPGEDMGAFELSIPGVASGFGRRFQARLLSTPPQEPLSAYCHDGRQVFDADQIGDVLQVRHRRAGDRFRPLGMTGSRKLKAMFNDRGLTRPERDRQLVIESDSNIIWLPGFAVSRESAVTDATRRIVELCIDEPDLQSGPA